MKPRVVAVLLMATACGGEKAPVPDSAALVAPSAPAPMSAVMIVSPAEGDTTGADVTIVLSKQGVTIEKANSTRAEGIGHHHLFLDTLATPEGEVIPPTSQRVIHIGTGDSTYTFKGLPSGRHEVIAVIGYGDHSAMPQRRDTVRFFVRR
ncbi:MAG TPA: DUF4399 domain-containing protein [Gemmatimonadaceae bacterium]|nr:DUF4399 domain-containing protein [Gemmatimonadaceae bacterium]